MPVASRTQNQNPETTCCSERSTILISITSRPCVVWPLPTSASSAGQRIPAMVARVVLTPPPATVVSEALPTRARGLPWLRRLNSGPWFTLPWFLVPFLHSTVQELVNKRCYHMIKVGVPPMLEMSLKAWSLTPASPC